MAPPSLANPINTGVGLNILKQIIWKAPKLQKLGSTLSSLLSCSWICCDYSDPEPSL